MTFLSACTVQRCSNAAGPELPHRLPDPGCPVGDHERWRPQTRGRSCPGRRRASCHSSHGSRARARGEPCGPPASRPSTPARPPPARHRGAASDRSHPRSSRRCRAAQGAADTTGGIARECPRRSARPCSWTRSAPRRLPPARPPHPAWTDPARKPADHQRLQGVRAGHALAENPAHEPQLARVANPRTLQVHRAARRLDRPRFMPITVADRLASALISLPAEELRDLVLERLLQDQPRTQAADHLDRVVAPRRHRPAPHPVLSETSRSGLPSPCGRTSIAWSCQDKAEATPATSIPPAHGTRP